MGTGGGGGACLGSHAGEVDCSLVVVVVVLVVMVMTMIDVPRQSCR